MMARLMWHMARLAPVTEAVAFLTIAGALRLPAIWAW